MRIKGQLVKSNSPYKKKKLGRSGAENIWGLRELGLGRVGESLVLEMGRVGVGISVGESWGWGWN